MRGAEACSGGGRLTGPFRCQRCPVGRPCSRWRSTSPRCAGSADGWVPCAACRVGSQKTGSPCGLVSTPRPPPGICQASVTPRAVAYTSGHGGSCAQANSTLSSLRCGRAVLCVLLVKGGTEVFEGSEGIRASRVSEQQAEDLGLSGSPVLGPSPA